MFSEIAAAGLLSLSGAASECQIAPRTNDPPRGLKVEMAMGGPVTLTETLGETEAGRTDYERTYGGWGLGLSAASKEKFKRIKPLVSRHASIRGVFPVADRGARGETLHSRSYQRDPAEALVGLAVGQSVRIPSRETVYREGAEAASADAPVVATFKGCVTSPIAGAPEQLLMYEIETSTLALNEKEIFEPRPFKRLVGISPRLGWRVYEQPLEQASVARSISFGEPR